jgi:TetR/AcrR family transcriptional repressor of nem operon
MKNAATHGQIVEAADRLFYERGYEHTSFSDIARDVKISRGNFYYYFKTKDEILDAVIARRLAATQQMLDAWEQAGDTPEKRIQSFTHILIQNQAKIMLHGCPVGTLCGELAKLKHPSKEDAARLFTLFRDWLARQFEILGRQQDADMLAMHLLSRSQGVAALANAFHDQSFIRTEVDLMDEWLTQQIPGPRRSRKH